MPPPRPKSYRQACAVFGITDVRILGFPQPFRLEHYPESIEALRDVILDVRPHVLITTSPSSDGQRVVISGLRDDHTESVRALMDARTIGVGLRPSTRGRTGSQPPTSWASTTSATSLTS